MAFRDFTFPSVQESFDLNLVEVDLFAKLPSLTLSPEFMSRIHEGIELALAINTEKARSEFIIAPILLELHRMLGGKFGLFSGVELDVDSSRGLNGFCDFIISKSAIQSVLTSPLIAIVEAKNDNLRNGFGQCIAAMVASIEFNAKHGTNIRTIYGLVTTGSAWKFVRLTGRELALDRKEYFITELAEIMGVIAHICSSSEAAK